MMELVGTTFDGRLLVAMTTEEWVNVQKGKPIETDNKEWIRDFGEKLYKLWTSTGLNNRAYYCLRRSAINYQVSIFKDHRNRLIPFDEWIKLFADEQLHNQSVVFQSEVHLAGPKIYQYILDAAKKYVSLDNTERIC